MAAKDRARGKAFELYVGRLFGGRRRTNGERGGFDDCVPVEGGLMPVSIECKAYAVPQLREDWLEQAERNAGDRPWALFQRRRKGSKKLLMTVDGHFGVELVKCWVVNHQTEEGQVVEGDVHR